MDPITFADTLVHYKLKLLEALSYTESVSGHMDDALICVEDSWSGQAADACRIKLEDMKLEMEKAQLAINNAIASVDEVIALEQAII